MPSTTPNYALPYQTLADAPDGPSLGEDLALAVDVELARIDAAAARRVGLVARRVAALSAATGVAVSIVWDTEDYDSDSMLAAGSTITIPLAGVYTISVQANPGVSAAGVLLLLVTSALAGSPATEARSYCPSDEQYYSLSTTLRLSAGDTFSVQAVQKSGSTRNFTGAIQCWRVAA